MSFLAPAAASTATAATRQPRLSRPAHTDGFQPARRGTAVSVGVPPTDPNQIDRPSQQTEQERFASEVIRLTNVQRRAAGVPPVAMHPNLMFAADTHARDVASRACRVGVLSHTGSDGSNAGQRIARTGLSFVRWSENIGCGQTSPRQMVEGWMASTGHRANLLDPRHTHIGVDVEAGDGGVLFWVQNFAVVTG